MIVARAKSASPLQAGSHYVVDPLGGFITGWSGDYSLRVSRDGRDTVALFGRPWTPPPVSGAEKRRLVDQRIAEMTARGRSGLSEDVLRAAFDPSYIPDTRPAYDVFAVDAVGRRWIQRSQIDTTVVRFDLFDREGRWLDVVDVPAGGWPRTAYASVGWGRDEVAVMLEDDDGRPLVRVYRIVRS